jgi:hypothetical protein
MNNISEHERFRRGEHARDSRAALAQNQTLEKRLAQRDAKADTWAKYLRHKMDAARCTDPVEVLPEALAKLEQLLEDRIAVATKEIKAALREALK